MTRTTYRIQFQPASPSAPFTPFRAPLVFTRKTDAIRAVVREVAIWRRGQGPLNQVYRNLYGSTRQTGFTAWAKAGRMSWILQVQAQPFATIEIIASEGGQA